MLSGTLNISSDHLLQPIHNLLTLEGLDEHFFVNLRQGALGAWLGYNGRFDAS